MAHKDDIGLPKATVNKFIKECAPADLKISNEARKVIAEASLEFLQLISSESNEICTKEKKNIILGDYVVKALENLGFVEFLDEVKEQAERYKREAAEKMKNTKRVDKFSEEDLAAQQALFAKANKRPFEDIESEQ